MLSGDAERLADRMVQVGKVETAEADGRVRVYFPETGIISDRLWCVGCAPEAGDAVLVLYEARAGGRGFVLGVIGGTET